MLKKRIINGIYYGKFQQFYGLVSYSVALFPVLTQEFDSPSQQIYFILFFNKVD